MHVMIDRHHYHAATFDVTTVTTTIITTSATITVGATIMTAHPSLYPRDIRYFAVGGADTLVSLWDLQGG